MPVLTLAEAEELVAQTLRRCRTSEPNAASVARALVAAPKLILADEPTGNLDTTNGEEVMRLLVKLNEEGTTVIMVTHSRSHAEYGRRVVNMLDGRVLSENVRQLRDAASREAAHG